MLSSADVSKGLKSCLCHPLKSLKSSGLTDWPNFHSNSKKVKNKMMGWIENGPSKFWPDFSSINTLPPKSKCGVLDLSVLDMPQSPPVVSRQGASRAQNQTFARYLLFVNHFLSVVRQKKLSSDLRDLIPGPKSHLQSLRHSTTSPLPPSEAIHIIYHLTCRRAVLVATSLWRQLTQRCRL